MTPALIFTALSTLAWLTLWAADRAWPRRVPKAQEPRFADRLCGAVVAGTLTINESRAMAGGLSERAKVETIVAYLMNPRTPLLFPSDLVGAVFYPLSTYEFTVTRELFSKAVAVIANRT